MGNENTVQYINCVQIDGRIDKYGKRKKRGSVKGIGKTVYNKE